MVVLTDLPDEILLPIVAGVSPLYIESLALCCKRFYRLCAEVVPEHDRIRSEISTNNNPYPYRAALFEEWPYYKSWPYGLVRRLLHNPSLAEYPTSLTLYDDHFIVNDAPEDLIAEINTQTSRDPHAYLIDTENSKPNAAKVVIPLMITQLLNLRKIHIDTKYAPCLIAFMSKIIEISRDPILSREEPLILGRLKEAEISSFLYNSDGTELALLLSMLPTLKKLHVIRNTREEPYVYPHEYHDSAITDLLLDGEIDSEFIVEMIQRAKSLQNFTYRHMIYRVTFEPRRLLATLKECARQRLIFLCLMTLEGCSLGPRGIDDYPNWCDYSMGSLRQFMVLKYLVAGVDMFIKTDVGRNLGRGVKTVQRLVSWLPASLETLVLSEGMGDWDEDILRMLFRGFRNQKNSRLPNLKCIRFYGSYKIDEIMPHAIKEAFRETEVSISYTNFICFDHSHECVQDWEGHEWKEFSEDCCEYE